MPDDCIKKSDDECEEEEKELTLKEIEDKLSPEEFLSRAIVKNRIVKKMAQYMMKIDICNKHLYSQGSSDRMLIEDLLDALPKKGSPGLMAFKTAWQIEELVNEATMLYLEMKEKTKIGVK